MFSVELWAVIMTKTSQERAEEKQANLQKHNLVIRMVKTLSDSNQYTPEQLYKAFDNLMGYRTWGETLDVQEHLQNCGVKFM